MRLMRFYLSYIIVVIIFLNQFSLSAFAGGDFYNYHIDAVVKNIPDDAVYFDLLIKKSDLSDSYVDLNVQNTERMGFDYYELVNYSKDDFVSYSSHYNGVITDNGIINNSKNIKCLVDYGPQAWGIKETDPLWELHIQSAFYELLDSELKVVLLNANGKIIAVSEAFTIHQTSENLFRGIVYDYLLNIVEIEYYHNEKNHSYYFFLIIAFLVLLFLTLVALCKIIRVLKKRTSRQ